ncbi:hypothetical protein EI42_04368 [Thermosporothrix hazakensis]|jgi:hypothetical protein|uniref:Uncharacterized protein n=1 Tax=Thermosporothrix hazakensis TaxID=644383 RepID=A0A326U2X3_THEHA|nr:hypothetical protein [Thermosporothrix hazakensis]PZW25316.1 hypothetical protein EI42_04368 [Thermosporothrix hazakensis]GCE50547.1 hypothetical protein KTH_54160 [Thermosporothrix hazakensis]
MRRQKKQQQHITPLFPKANDSTSLPTTDLVWPVYEQVRKSDGAFNVPHLHLSFNDVRVVDHIIASYSTSLQKTSHVKPSHRAKIQRLGQLRARLHGLLAHEQKGALSSAALLLTLDDLELLNEVLEPSSPSSNGSRSGLRSVTSWCRRFGSCSAPSKT